jgi:hypothetical protein
MLSDQTMRKAKWIQSGLTSAVPNALSNKQPCHTAHVGELHRKAHWFPGWYGPELSSRNQDSVQLP